ncbi:MAG: tetratricopeptide repeat protein [Bacteroidia bacterium]|nr:tetratricopeptide repeat protein [Bacteroidia bacterium]NNK29006.1 tetratricopeptide repeat protein [Flavobacteriaceae bacterium]
MFIFDSLLKKAYITIGFFCLFLNPLFAQDQRLSDRLQIIYQNGDYDESEELRILQQIAESETDTEKIITYSLQLIVAAKNLDSAQYEFSGYLQKGNAYRLRSDMTKALESYFDAAKIASEAGLKSEEASINISIADVYSIMGDNETSVGYYKEALELMKEESDSQNLAYLQLNLGDEYYKQDKLDSALYYFNESGKILEALEDEFGGAYKMGNVGLVYAKKGDNDLAELNLEKAVRVLEEFEDYAPICEYLNAMSEIYQEQGKNKKAFEFAQRSLDLAEKYGLKEQVSNSYLKLSGFYEDSGDYRKSLDHYQSHIAYRDSVNSIKNVQQMAKERTEFEVSQKQAEVNLLNQQKKTQKIMVIATGVALFLILLLAIGLLKRNKFMKKTNAIIEYEKQLSDDLLKNILPEETAAELKESGEVKAKQFNDVSVLFTDFKGFTAQSEKLSPEELVKSIDFYFSKFDEIIGKYGLEKIKTIGDAYMCAAGLPFPIENQTVKICQAGLEIIEFVQKTKRDFDHKLAKFDIRVGINTGPVVAGVVGTKKFQYDIWGDSVNTASRMESSGDINKVNISESTYEELKKYDVFKFEPRGSVEAKGKGKIQMYFVEYSY